MDDFGAPMRTGRNDGGQTTVSSVPCLLHRCTKTICSRL